MKQENERTKFTKQSTLKGEVNEHEKRRVKQERIFENGWGRRR